jgi:hypothetical protein
MTIKKNFFSRTFIVLTSILVIFLSESVRADEIPMPTYPVEPVYSDVKSDKKDPETKETGIAVEVMVILGTSDEVRGTISLPDRIYFKHLKNGLLYEKTISPEQLQSLNILEYSQSSATATGNRKFYSFEPALVEIKLNDGSVFRIDRIFSFLKSFNIETVNGKTKLHTIFGDSFENGKGWANVESKDPGYHKSTPHPASVKKIIFLKITR